MLDGLSLGPALDPERKAVADLREGDTNLALRIDPADVRKDEVLDGDRPASTPSPSDAAAAIASSA